MRYGARSMFSMPPATALSIKPSITSCAALAIACAPEPQTRLTVSAGTSTGTPPLMAACRAGFILLPAWITLPMTTVSISPGDSFARSSVARTATAPRSTAAISFSVPPYVPMAVRTGEQITTSLIGHGSSPLFWRVLHDPHLCIFAAGQASVRICAFRHNVIFEHHRNPDIDLPTVLCTEAVC